MITRIQKLLVLLALVWQVLPAVAQDPYEPEVVDAASQWLLDRENKRLRHMAQNFDAFRHVGVGFEMGLLGHGIQVAVPVVDDCLIAVLGYDWGEYSYKTRPRIHEQAFNGVIDDLMLMATPEQAAQIARPRPDDYVRLDMKTRVRNQNIHLLAEYYPFRSRTFHVTAGAMYAPKNYARLRGSLYRRDAITYQALLRVNDEMGQPKNPDDLYQLFHFNFNGTTYTQGPAGTFEATLPVWRIRPYVGVGFGRSIPNYRLGWMVEMGAWWKGKEAVKSPNAVAPSYDAEACDHGMLEFFADCPVVPHISFRLVGRVF